MAIGPRPRTPGVLYGVIVLVLLVLIGILAMTVNPPPPPTIAEFAPQAVDQITDAPSDQSSDSGSGDAGLGGGDGVAAAEPTPEVIEQARVRKCVGDPPRQIEDPQSPPCVPYWSGDNGGDTAKGVTRDTITILTPRHAFPASDDVRLMAALQAFFNRRFEFYGRHMFLIDPKISGARDPATKRAEAAGFDEEYEPFASLDAIDGSTVDYHYELARRGILSTTHMPVFAESELAAYRPHLWMYPMAADRILSQLGEWTCARLAGRNAAHAGVSGATDMRTSPRKFGLILQQYSTDQHLTAAPIDDGLRRCGSGLTERFVFSAGGADQPGAQNMMIQMRDRGVTSVMCICDLFIGRDYQAAATQQTYFPEWMFTSMGGVDHNTWGSVQNTEHWQRAFGLSMYPKQLPPAHEPAFWATQEMDPGMPPPPSSADAYFWRRIYKPLLLLASGIQMAGPALTAESFERGLHKTVFPNPETPFMAGSVGFRDGDHTMTDDAAELWWSSTARGPIGSDSGAYCYVDGGVRHRPGTWPKEDDRMFQANCDTGAET